ncbi:hypothetical protein GUITHDRAFT_155693, partial [Guillardia theta CCMP2712]
MARRKKSKAKMMQEKRKEDESTAKKNAPSPKKRQRAIIDSDVDSPSSDEDEIQLLADDYADNLTSSHRHSEDEQEEELEDIRAGILLNSITMFESEQMSMEPMESMRKKQRRRAKATTSLQEVALKLSRFVYHSTEASHTIKFSAEDTSEALKIVRLGNAFGLQGSVKEAAMVREIRFDWQQEAVIPKPVHMRRLLLALGEHVEDEGSLKGRMRGGKLEAALRKKPKKARSIAFSSAGHMQEGQQSSQRSEAAGQEAA